MLLLFLILLTGLLVLVGGCLLGCWLIARSRGYAQLGRGVALFSAKRALHLSQLFARGAAYCKSRSVALLMPWYLREQQEESKESRFAGVAIWRLITLAVSVLVILGELPIWVLRSPALYTFLRQTPLLPFDLLSVFVGLLWMFVSGVFGLWFAEAVKFMPPWAGLFPYRHWVVRVVCAAIALSFLVFSLYENYWLTAYTQCLLVSGCQTNALMPVNIAAGFNVA